MFRAGARGATARGCAGCCPGLSYRVPQWRAWGPRGPPRPFLPGLPGALGGGVCTHVLPTPRPHVCSRLYLFLLGFHSRTGGFGHRVVISDWFREASALALARPRDGVHLAVRGGRGYTGGTCASPPGRAASVMTPGPLMPLPAPPPPSPSVPLGTATCPVPGTLTQLWAWPSQSCWSGWC